MELRTARDAMALIFLSCFILITNFLYSQSLPTALYMLVTLMVIMASWVHLHAPGIAIKPRLRVAAVLLLQAIPLTLILFILFPRVPGPLWGLPQDAFARSGLDDTMSPGSVGRLALSDAVAFRVSYQGKPPPRSRMYWRGPVLWDFDGHNWTPGRATQGIAPQFSATGRATAYSVTLEPHNKRWLFALDMPDSISVPARLTDDFQLLNSEPVNERLRYEARSRLDYHANLQESPSQLQRALQLPPTLNPRARQLATSWRADDDQAVVRRALDYLNEQNFYYTLEPPTLGRNSTDDFLFITRRGFCEHYASAFVFLMRAAGIPARVVTGYQGGEYNAYGNYHIVRQSDAHAWAEVWLTGQGWVRIDPTAAIAPERVERGLSAALTDNTALPFMSRNPPLWLRDLRLNWDALANQWNQRVLGYDSERQFAFLSRFGMESISLQVIYMTAGLALMIALPLAFAALILSSEYRMKRVIGFMDPWSDPYGKGYQLSHALIAFGRGEWTGVGLGGSVEKLFYLPEAHTDFLMAVTAEELGIMGVFAVLALFAALVVRAYSIGRQAAFHERNFAALVAQGIAVWLAVQTMINVGVNMGVLPTKGLTLPLLSFGGSGIVVNCIAVAILLRIDWENRRLMRNLPA
jgi:transglutaminase-like putative cysteine protease